MTIRLPNLANLANLANPANLPNLANLANRHGAAELTARHDVTGGRGASALGVSETRPGEVWCQPASGSSPPPSPSPLSSAGLPVEPVAAGVPGPSGSQPRSAARR